MKLGRYGRTLHLHCPANGHLPLHENIAPTTQAQAPRVEQKVIQVVTHAEATDSVISRPRMAPTRHQIQRLVFT